MSIINLPCKFLQNIIDVDDPEVIIPMKTAMKTLEQLRRRNNEDQPLGIRTCYSNPVYDEITKKTTYEYDYSFFNSIVEKRITLINPDIKYWNIRFKFFTDQELTVPVPGFVKFYSTFNHQFIPVEFVKKSDLLVDWHGRMVQIMKKTEVEDSKALLQNSNFYNIQFNPGKEYFNQIYLNGILTSVAFNNYTE